MKIHTRVGLQFPLCQHAGGVAESTVNTSGYSSHHPPVSSGCALVGTCAVGSKFWPFL